MIRTPRRTNSLISHSHCYDKLTDFVRLPDDDSKTRDGGNKQKSYLMPKGSLPLPQLEVDGKVPTGFEFLHGGVRQEPRSDAGALFLSTDARESLQELHAQQVVGVLRGDHARCKNA